MLHPILEEGYVCARNPPVSVEKRKSSGRALHLFRRRPVVVVLGSMTACRPAQSTVERKRAAWIKHAVKIGAGELHHARGRSWSRRFRNPPLCVTKARAATGQNMAVVPRLFCNPSQS